MGETCLPGARYEVRKRSSCSMQSRSTHPVQVSTTTNNPVISVRCTRETGTKDGFFRDPRPLRSADAEICTPGFHSVQSDDWHLSACRQRACFNLQRLSVTSHVDNERGIALKEKVPKSPRVFPKILVPFFLEFLMSLDRYKEMKDLFRSLQKKKIREMLKITYSHCMLILKLKQVFRVLCESHRGHIRLKFIKPTKFIATELANIVSRKSDILFISISTFIRFEIFTMGAEFEIFIKNLHVNFFKKKAKYLKTMLEPS